MRCLAPTRGGASHIATRRPNDHHARASATRAHSFERSSGTWIGADDVYVARRILGLVSLVCAIVVPIVLVPGTAVGSREAQASSLDQGLLTQLNQARVSHGLTPFTLNSQLSEAAVEHSNEMAQQGYFGHDSASGQPFWKRIELYYPTGKDHYWSVGENILWSAGSVDASSAMRAWMASPDHRANILSTTWHQVGIGAVSAAHAPGTFGGQSVTVITTDFGVRR